MADGSRHERVLGCPRTLFVFRLQAMRCRPVSFVSFCFMCGGFVLYLLVLALGQFIYLLIFILRRMRKRRLKLTAFPRIAIHVVYQLNSNVFTVQR